MFDNPNYVPAAKSQAVFITKKKYNFISLVQLALTIILVMLIFFSHYGTAIVPSASMVPTLTPGTVLIYSYQSAQNLTYDDIVVFFPECDETLDTNGWFKNWVYQHIQKETVYVKRVVGLPGDVLEVKEGHLWRNGEMLSPNYVVEEMNDVMAPYVVPNGYIFCMGDNRNNSLDSRYYGPFAENLFFGKVVFSFSAK